MFFVNISIRITPLRPGGEQKTNTITWKGKQEVV